MSNKKKVAIVFSGQSRCNPLSHPPHIAMQEIITKSYVDFFFTENFKAKYDYDIFISTDDIHLTNAYNFFGLNLKNIHLFNTGYYSTKIENDIPPIEDYFNKYNLNDFSNFQKYDNSIYQYYKLFDAYNLLKNYKLKNNVNYDFIIRSRLDTKYQNNITDYLTFLEENEKCKMFGHWDFFAVGRADIMDIYCSAIDNNYGTYFNPTRNNSVHSLISCGAYNNLLNEQAFVWKFAPEIQLFEILFEYCDKNNLIIDETIKECCACEIVR